MPVYVPTPAAVPSYTPARAWLQAPFKAPASCTIRVHISAPGGNHDWTVAAGTTWDSLDDMVAAWNTALGGHVLVTLVPDLTTHRANVIITTDDAVTYTVTWSHSGDGTAIRNRLGATGDIGTHTSGTVAWSGVVVGAFYTWVGLSTLTRGRTGIDGGAAARMIDGTIVSQHSRDTGDDPIEMDLAVRWGLPPGGATTARMQGHLALEAFFTDLYTAANTPSDTFAVYQYTGDTTAERWLVRLAEDRPHVNPTCLVQPHQVFEATLKLDCVEAPL